MELKTSTKKKNSFVEAYANIDKALFFVPLSIIFILCVLVVVFPDSTQSAISMIFSFVTGDMGWLLQLFFMINLAIMLYFIFGKYAKKRFGAEKPEFSTPVWLGMLFTGGTSSSIVYWGAIEWYYYLAGPPFGAEPFSTEAMEWATSYSFFNWGPSCFGLYATIAVVFAFFFFVKKEETNRLSIACESLLKKHSRGAVGKIIDIIYMVGIIGGVGASIGLGTPLVSELLSTLLGLEHTLMMDAGIILFWTVFFIVGVYGGLNKTIKAMSNLRVILVAIGCLFIFIFASKSFMLNTFIDSIGIMINNYFRMALYTDPSGAANGFPQNWTIFFFAWFLAYALSTGIYMARISRGRTVRELVIGGTFAALICIYLHFVILGYYGVEVYSNGTIDLTAIFNAGGAAAAIVGIWNTLPFPKFIMIVFVLLILISMITVINGTAYTLSIVATKKLKGSEEPAKLNRVFWALALGSIGFALIFLGGLQPIQTACVATGFLTMIIIALIFFTFFKYDMRHWDSYMAKGGQDAVEDTKQDTVFVPDKFAGSVDNQQSI